MKRSPERVIAFFLCINFSYFNVTITDIVVLSYLSKRMTKSN